MSYVEMLGIGEDMRTTKILALHGSANWAIDLWASLCDTYVQSGLSYGARFQLRERVWELADDPRVPLAQRRALGMTFDRAVVRAADYARAAADMRQAPAGHHWPTMARFVEDGGAAGYPMFGFIGHSSSPSTFEEQHGDPDRYGDRPWRPIDPASVYDVYAEVT